MTSDETWQAYNDWGGYSFYSENATGSPWCCSAQNPAGDMSNLTSARNAGVNLAFFTGNTAWWKTRWANSQYGNEPYRTLITDTTTRSPVGARQQALAGVVARAGHGAGLSGGWAGVPVSAAAPGLESGLLVSAGR